MVADGIVSGAGNPNEEQYLRELSVFRTVLTNIVGQVYTVVRLAKLDHCHGKTVVEMLDREIGGIYAVASILELHDESWELVVLKSYLPTLDEKLGRMFPGCHVDLHYDPSKPDTEVARNLGYDTAKALTMCSFWSRADSMIRDSWPVAATYYSYLTERYA